jgi:hypothetical protein
MVRLRHAIWRRVLGTLIRGCSDDEPVGAARNSEPACATAEFGRSRAGPNGTLEPRGWLLAAIHGQAIDGGPTFDDGPWRQEAGGPSPGPRRLSRSRNIKAQVPL